MCYKLVHLEVVIPSVALYTIHMNDPIHLPGGRVPIVPDLSTLRSQQWKRYVQEAVPMHIYLKLSRGAESLTEIGTVNPGYNPTLTATREKSCAV
jgi:hypothetical protein